MNRGPRVVGRCALYTGDCREILAQMPEGSVDCIVTSPPYWGLRDYGIDPVVWGGDPGCDHDWLSETVVQEMRTGLGLAEFSKRYRGGGIKAGKVPNVSAERAYCPLCGAWRGVLGLEPTIDLFVEHMVEVASLMRRVLKPSGTLWLNLGDSYNAATGARKPSKSADHGYWSSEAINRRVDARASGLKPKDLCMIPARVALALQAEGWWLRSEIVWAKPNPMPESIKDRPTTAHEKVFMLAKSARYFYDAEAVKEPVTGNAHPRRSMKTPDGWDTSTGEGGHGTIHRKGREKGKKARSRDEAFVKSNERFHATTTEIVDSRNLRNVWTIASQAFPEAHFATFPPALAERCIKAGCPPDGMVLDPFGGAGTVGLVAERLGRYSMLIEANPDYVEMALARIVDDAPLLTATDQIGAR